MERAMSTAAPPASAPSRGGPVVNRCDRCGRYASHGYGPPGPARAGVWPGPVVWACGTHRAEAEAAWQSRFAARPGAPAIAPQAQGTLL